MPLSPPSPHAHQSGSPLIPSFLVFFTEASLPSHDWLNHWPLAIDSTSSPSPLLGGQAGSNSLITWLVLLGTRPHPWVLSKSHLININLSVVERGFLWISRNLFALLLFFPLFCRATWHAGCRILVPWPEIEPVPPAVEAWSPNHWTAREFPLSHLIT